VVCPENGVLKGNGVLIHAVTLKCCEHMTLSEGSESQSPYHGTPFTSKSRTEMPTETGSRILGA
jgi:hypothetical protein